MCNLFLLAIDHDQVLFFGEQVDASDDDYRTAKEKEELAHGVQGGLI